MTSPRARSLSPFLAPLLALLFAVVPGLAAFAEVSPADWVTTYHDGVSIRSVALDVDADGNSYVVSTIVRRDFELRDGDGEFDVLTVTKFDPSGGLLWQSELALPEGEGRAVDLDLGAGEEAVYAVGTGYVGEPPSRILAVKLDAETGARIWLEEWEAEEGLGAYAEAASATPDGGIAVTGGAWRGDERLDFATFVLDADGGLRWEAFHSHDTGYFLFNDDRGEAIAVEPGGDVVISGTAGQASSDVKTFRYDGATGVEEWMAVYSTPGDEFPTALALAPDGDAVVLVSDPEGIDRRWAIVRYDAVSGLEEWRYLLDPGFDEWPRSVATDAAGDVYAVGSTDPDGDDSNGNPNLILVAVDGATGAEKWLEEFGGEDLGEGDHGNDVLTRGEHVYVVGSSSSEIVVGPQHNAFAVVWEYDAATGALLDLETVDTTEDPADVVDDSFFAASFDAEANLYAAGMTYDDPDPDDSRLELARFATTAPADSEPDPEPGPPLLSDGFESGDWRAWSAASGGV